MGIEGPKERATYSLSANVKARLEQAVPKSERSKYVDEAVDRALREDAKKRFRAFLSRLPRASDRGDSTEFLRNKRLEWDGRPIDVLEGRKK